MYCPQCGTDAGEANFCPECGTALTGVKTATSRSGGKVRTTGAPRTTSSAGRSRRAYASDEFDEEELEPVRASRPAQPARQGRQPVRTSTFSPKVIWILVAIAAVTALAVVFVVNRDGAVAGSGSPSTGSVASAPVADTSGSYQELVSRANGLYDKGATLGQSSDTTAQNQSAEYFASAAKVYAAAWKKQSGDPAVGTDYATSLFYAGQIEAAIKQIDKVLAKDPTFQNALYNKGNYVAMKARIAKQNGQTAAATKLFAEAKTSYDAAVKVDPNSASGQQAAQQAALVAKGQ